MDNSPKIITLPNGLRIVTEHIPFVRSVSFGVWVRTGSRNEAPSQNGYSHFIEHMLFKGTARRTAAEIADTMDEMGGHINAYTSKECTCYYTRTLDSHFDIALDVLADMFFHSRFAPEEVAKERNVILEEINMYEDTPEDVAQNLLQEAVFPGHPLGQAILGTPESLAACNDVHLRGYFAQNYRPENTVVTLAGNFNAAAVDKLRAVFEAAPWPQHAPAHNQATPAVYTPAFAKREKDIEQVHLCLGFPGIPAGHPDAYPLAAAPTVTS